jgi:hypothetical protein
MKFSGMNLHNNYQYRRVCPREASILTNNRTPAIQEYAFQVPMPVYSLFA